MNHNGFVLPASGCEAGDHGHAPTSANATDYARRYIAAHNEIFAQIRRAKPDALIFENLPTVYDLGNPMPDAIWVNDGFHIPQFMWLMLDYLTAQRRLWPMEMRFTNYVSMNLEPGDASTYLIANIAFGNHMAIGADLRHTSPKLKEFYRKWIAFYRANREWLCTNIHLLAPNIIGHRLPGQFLVFVFNDQETPQEISIQFPCPEAGLSGTEIQVVEDSGDAQKQVGTTRPHDGQINWSHRVEARGFRVLRFK